VIPRAADSAERNAGLPVTWMGWLLVLAACLLLAGCVPEPPPDGWWETGEAVDLPHLEVLHYKVSRQGEQLSILLTAGRFTYGIQLVAFSLVVLVLAPLFAWIREWGAMAVVLLFGLLVLPCVGFFSGEERSLYGVDGVTLEEGAFFNVHTTRSLIPVGSVRAVEVRQDQRRPYDPIYRWVQVIVVHDGGEHEALALFQRPVVNPESHQRWAEEVARMVRERLGLPKVNP